jgi:2-polyprenyl-3-methyl-5-hydroxy-6-metoxy-1,4-benzoquinol methylase
MTEQRLSLTKEELDDIFEWDITNWSRCAEQFEDHMRSGSGKKGLELGGRRGGLSLWMAMRGYDVVCSDLSSPKEKAEGLHQKYGRTDNIIYEAINALNIPYKEHFDLIMFKSILGGVSREGNDHRKPECINQIYEALKPGGQIVFAENLAASWIHRSLRKKFVKWGDLWNYLEYRDIEQLFHQFSEIEIRTVGFFGAFGRSENQRRLFGLIDKTIDWIIPKSSRYILFMTAKK